MVNQMPPVPRDHDQASFSELVPLGSRKIKLWRSPLLVFGIISVVIGVMLFVDFGKFNAIYDYFQRQPQGPRKAEAGQLLLAQFKEITRLTTGYLLLAVLVLMMIYSRTDRTLLYVAVPFLVVTFIQFTPVHDAFFWIFRDLPLTPLYGKNYAGDVLLNPRASFIDVFFGMFLAAGLCEELWKATPCLLAAMVTLFAARVRPHLPANVFDFLRVRGPLDAMLMGLAGGAAFILWETADEYVFKPVFGRAGSGDLGVGFAGGLLLMMPRIIFDLAGHMGWSAIFCYFIGLAVIRPRRAVPLILSGWVVASLMHAMWNSSMNLVGGWEGHYVVGGVTVLIMMACFLKARQLDATLFGRGSSSSGSIVVGGPEGAYMPPAPAYMPPPAPGYMPPPGAGYMPPPAPPPMQPPPVGGPAARWGAPGTAPGPAPGPSPAPAPQWGAQAAPPPAPSPGAFPGAPPGAAPYPQAPQQAPAAAYPAGGMALAIAGVNIPLTPGARFDLSSVPAIGERGRGMVGEVSVHPRNPGVLGLKNLSTAVWYARMRDGSVQQIEPQRNIRLAGGMSIDFGGGIQAAVIG